MTTAVAAIWIVALAAAYLSLVFVVPLLLRLARAATKIERYARDTHEASTAITRHLEVIPALDDTAELLAGAHGVGGRIAAGAERLRDVLADRAEGSR